LIPSKWATKARFASRRGFPSGRMERPSGRDTSPTPGTTFRDMFGGRGKRRARARNSGARGQRGGAEARTSRRRPGDTRISAGRTTVAGRKTKIQVWCRIDTEHVRRDVVSGGENHGRKKQLEKVCRQVLALPEDFLGRPRNGVGVSVRAEGETRKMENFGFRSG